MQPIVPGLVSVIIPVFNREEMLLDAVKCVEAQTYRPVEVILVDDGSTDGTGQLCDRLRCEKQELVRTFHRPNGGPGAARETGRAEARGEYIQYLDSDDLLLPRKLETQTESLRQRPAAGVSYCDTRERVADGTLGNVPSMKTGESIDSIFPTLLSGRCWQTVSPLWRRAASDLIGPWSDLRVEEDVEYDARAGALGIKPIWCREMLAEHRHHGSPRASGGIALDPAKMRDRARSHHRVYHLATQAGVRASDAHMQRYARELFLLSRQCGAAGLPAESLSLFRLAREASGPTRGSGLDFRLYRFAAALVGWEVAGAVACRADTLRVRRPGRSA